MNIIATLDDLLSAPLVVRQQFAYMLLQDPSARERFGITQEQAEELSRGYNPPPAPVLPDVEETQPIPVPNWDGFIQQMLLDPAYNQAMGIALQNRPGVAASFATVFAEAATNLPLFLGVLQIFKNITNPSAETLNRWAGWAEEYNLPQQLIEGILL